MVNNFYAITQSNEVKKIVLTQNVTPVVKDVFEKYGEYILNEETEQILFDGNYKLDDEEIHYVEMDLPDFVKEVETNSIGLETLDLKEDKIKTLFWYDDKTYFFQNFDSRKLLKNRNVIFYSGNTYSKLEEDAFVIDNVVNAIYKDNKFYFRSYVNANKVFPLIQYFNEASNEEIQVFAVSDKILVDPQWLTYNANSLMRKHITLLQKSKILDKADTKKIRTHANKFKLKLVLTANGKIVFPNDKKECKDILTFLNEQFFIGVITGNKYRTNSKRDV
jgi:hypothetical protein